MHHIHLYALASPEKVLRDIAESHSRSIERIGQKLALPPPPQPLPPGWQFDDADGRYCFTLTGFRREISIVVVRDGDGSRECWHWGFDWLGDDDESDKPIEEGEADDRQTAMREAEAAARRVMDADASSEGSEDAAGTALQQSQPTPQERADGPAAISAPIDAEGSETTDETEPEDALAPGWTRDDPDDFDDFDDFDDPYQKRPKYHYDLGGGRSTTVECHGGVARGRGVRA